MPTADHIRSNIVGSLYKSNVEALLTNLVDAALQIQERDAQIQQLEVAIKDLKSQPPLGTSECNDQTPPAVSN